MEPAYDVIVVGSGPAGGTAGYALARAGLRTLILEKARLPRYKPCGGGLTRKVLGILDFDALPLAEDSITRLVVGYRNRRITELHAPRPVAWCVMRDRFDTHLAAQAARAGAALHDGEAVRRLMFGPAGVEVETAIGHYRAAVVVGADGATGITARTAGLIPARTTAAALEVEMAVPPARLEEWRGAFYIDFGALPRGYAWIFPKGDHLSVGVGAFSPDRTPARGQPGAAAPPNLRAVLQAWVEAEPSLREHSDRLTRGHLVPLHDGPLPLHGPRVVLAGDAGRLINPFTGEGIYFAIRSGQIAAATIRRALDRGDLDLAAHTRQVLAEFRPHYLGARGLARVFYRFPEASLAILAHSRLVRTQVIRHLDRPGHQATRFVRAARRAGALLERV